MATRLQQVSSHLTGTANGGKGREGLLEGEVAIITGAAQGIGRSAAILFAKEGAKVVVSDLDEKKSQSVVEEIISIGGDAFPISGDVTANDFPKKLIDGTIKKYGKINHIVNNAGFTSDKMIHTMSDQTFDIILSVHNRAPFRIVREAAKWMRVKENDGQNRSIINVSSVSGLHGNTGQINYSTAKSGIIGMTKTIAKEWGPFGVRCNTIAFGYIETRLTGAKEAGESITINGVQIPLGIPSSPSPKSTNAPAVKSAADRIPDIPLGRPGTADEAARGMVFLASPLAGYISGHTLEVTGGRGI